jgi:hypothetical protein
MPNLKASEISILLVEKEDLEGYILDIQKAGVIHVHDLPLVLQDLANKHYLKHGTKYLIRESY